MSLLLEPVAFGSLLVAPAALLCGGFDELFASL
jgi:hypothetical protein